MTKCEVCQDTGMISRNRFGSYRPGMDRRYSIIDACPRCSYIAEMEYNQYVKLRDGLAA